jgi:hypothetical protein
MQQGEQGLTSSLLDPWGAFTISDTLTELGNTVTEGVTMVANNITDWVADLVSAGLGPEEAEE